MTDRSEPSSTSFSARAGHDREAPEHPLDDVLPGEARVLTAAHESLAGRRRGVRGAWPFLGPAFIAAVAYIDPGNFATNMAAGAKFGFLLLWVVVLANLMAMLVQSMSAKLGIATRKNLAEVCRDRFPRRVSVGLWVQAELIAMATDVAEFVGAAIGLNLLFGLPLFPAAVFTGLAAFLILGMQARGFRRLEAVIAGLIGVIVGAFAFQVLLADPSPSSFAGGLVPGLEGPESVLLAVGILGATVMPHVIYLHSALTQHRVMGVTEEVKRRIFHFELVDVVIAMSIAGLINVSMLAIAATVFYGQGLESVGEDLAGCRAPSARASAPTPTCSSGSLSSPPVSPHRASARCPARSSCRASSAARSRSSCAASSPCSPRSSSSRSVWTHRVRSSSAR
jgi:manganese transport protein